jgi:hypothetical protein
MFAVLIDLAESIESCSRAASRKYRLRCRLPRTASSEGSAKDKKRQVVLIIETDRLMTGREMVAVTARPEI